MIKKDKEEIFELFAEAFKEVVLPELEDMKEDIDYLKISNDRIERQLSRSIDRQDDHGKRITKLEKKQRIVN